MASDEQAHRSKVCASCLHFTLDSAQPREGSCPYSLRVFHDEYCSMWVDRASKRRAEQSLLESAVVQAALADRRAEVELASTGENDPDSGRAFIGARSFAYYDARDALDTAVDALLVFLGEGTDAE